MEPIRELVLAAEDLINAQCTRHRNRARLRVLRAIESVESPSGTPPAREELVTDLALFADGAGQDGDPEGTALAERCFNHGILVREELRGD